MHSVVPVAAGVLLIDATAMARYARARSVRVFARWLVARLSIIGLSAVAACSGVFVALALSRP